MEQESERNVKEDKHEGVTGANEKKEVKRKRNEKTKG